MNKLHWKKKVL